MPITIGAKRESDFTDPIGMLGDCHRRIERFLHVLVSVAKQNGGLLDDEQRTALITSLRYFREAAPKHTADEEDSLFPRLRRTGDAEASALLARIESLEQEHECASKVHYEVDQLGQRWLDQLTLTVDEASRLSTLVGQLAILYRRHIEIEDTEIFPVAAKVLSPADRTSVGAEMASRRGIA
uniref:Hemerythrin HHE cation binding domain protein n=1 Tax=Solibacter usitatus (strain Ellin6076) TaxID=234267 RepID=Q023C7_SOLUE